MLWITETPVIVTASQWVLPILKKPIYWLRGTCNSWTQYCLYIKNIARYDRFNSKKIFHTYELDVGEGEKIRMVKTIFSARPKMIIIYCHTVFGSCYEMSHIANELKSKPIVYFSYSRRGVHKDLSTNYFNITGSLEIFDKVLSHIESQYPSVPIHAIGASAGTCLLTKFLGSRNQEKRIKSAIYISPGYHFERTVLDMPQSIQDRILSELNRKYNHCSSRILNNSKTLTEWIMNHHSVSGYQSAKEYIQNNDPYYFLNSINVPVLMLSALDDFCFPGHITTSVVNKLKNNKNITVVITKYGGHISFLDYGASIPWSTRVIVDYFNAKLVL